MSRRLNEIEAKLNRLDPDSPEYAALDAEANKLIDSFNVAADAHKAYLKAKADERQAKIDEIVDMVAKGRMNELVAKYGDEFINDYRVEGLTIISKVSPEQWTEDSEELTAKKLVQLLYYRVYDHYVRDVSIIKR